MIAAGVDIGSATSKVVILSDGHILSKSLIFTGGDSAGAAHWAMEAALAGVSSLALSHIGYIVATGYRHQRSFPVQDPDPVRDMAMSSTMRRPYAQSIGERIDLTLDMCREYKVDGVILSYNPSCRMFYLLQSELKNALDREGIANLRLECDMADERTYSEGQVKTRLDAFIERLLAR